MSPHIYGHGGMEDIDPDGPEPVYRQLAAILREQIERGEIQPRRPIPSKAQLRGRYGVSGQTVDRAVDILRADGLLLTVKGKGLFVVPEEERGKG